MRTAIFVFAVLAFAAVVIQEGLAKSSGKQPKLVSTQYDGIIRKLPKLSPWDPLWLRLKEKIEENIKEAVYVLVIYKETFAYTPQDEKYIVFMNNQDDTTIYRLSTVRHLDRPRGDHRWDQTSTVSMPTDDGED